MKPWTEKNDIKMYSGHDDQISVAAERFIRTLKNKIRKYMTSKSKKFILINQMTQLINTTIYIVEQLKSN